MSPTQRPNLKPPTLGFRLPHTHFLRQLFRRAIQRQQYSLPTLFNLPATPQTNVVVAGVK